jgi:hypothetical protein
MDDVTQNGAAAGSAPDRVSAIGTSPPETALQDIITALVTGAFTLISGITALRALLRARKK